MPLSELDITDGFAGRSTGTAFFNNQAKGQITFENPTGPALTTY